MSKPSRPASRPSSGGGGSGGSGPGGSLRKDPQANRSCLLRVGERLMRAGSEGNLVKPRGDPQNRQNQQNQNQNQTALFQQTRDLPRSSSPSSAEDQGGVQQRPALSHASLSELPPRSPSAAPRRNTVSGLRDSGLRDGAAAADGRAMQPADAERRKEVFLDHLRRKYPHHAAIIMGHHERLRDQARSPLLSASPPPGLRVLGVGEQPDPLSAESLETMSEGDAVPTAAFTRGCRTRASLPLVRSASQGRDSSLGVLFLQYGEETRQVRMPGEIVGGDGVRALFAAAFPQQLTAKALASAAVYIRDDARNVYHELTDVRNITSRSCLKVYHRDPAHAFHRHAAPPPTKADGRIPREVLYGNQSPAHALQTAGRAALHGLPGSMSPPTARSMPSSPSRIPYSSRGGGGGGGGSGVPVGGGVGGVTPGEAGSATLPRDRMSSAGVTGRSATPCSSSSAIMERRDVKPDEDMGGSKTVALVVRGDGGQYPDPFPPTLQDGGRSMAAYPQGGAPAQQADVVDSGAGLHQLQHSLYRQKSRRYGESHLPPLGLKIPPPSPQWMVDGHSTTGRSTLERMSPVRRSLRRDSGGAAAEVVVGRTRSSVSSSSSSSAFADLPAVTPGDPQTSERMKAMEQQIASLTGLVQHALAIGPAISERDGKTATLPVNTSLARSPDPRTDVSGASPQAPPPDGGLRTALSSAQRNVTDLRLQLTRLRQMQVQNQESVRAMLRMMGEELASMAAERLRAAEGRSPEEPGRRQRAAVGDERLKYLTTEEGVLTQLGELEEYVEQLKRDSAPLSSSGPGPPSVSLKDVEEGAVTLRRVWEALAGLKGEFPGLQGRMRAVLRVEVEAVRFLKEEPLKMDSMLRRVKALTQALSELRRCVTENQPPGPEAGSGPAKPPPGAEGQESTDAADPPPPRPAAAPAPPSSPRPQPRSTAARPEATPPGAPASPVAHYRLRSSPAVAAPALPHHHASPPLTPTHGPDTPTVAKVSPRSREGSPALKKKAAGNAPSPPASVGETAAGLTAAPGDGHATAGAGAAEREGGAVGQTGDPQPSSDPAGFDHILQEAQASLLRAIPDLEVTESGDEEEEGDAPADPQPPTGPPPGPRSVSDRPPAPPDEPDAPPPPSPAAPEGAPPSPAPPADAPDPPVPGPPRAAAAAEKPGRRGLEGEGREGVVDRGAGKSPPPPPPPRRFYPASPGLTTGRSGEVIYTARKEHVATQEEEAVAVPVPQPKPIRQPPEVKPKPQTNQVAAPASETAQQEDEEEEDQFMKELQVFQKCSVREVGGARCVVDLSGSGSQAREIEAPPPVSPTHTQVLYYVTSRVSNEEAPSGATDQSEDGEGTALSSQVAGPNDLTQQPDLLTPPLSESQDGRPDPERTEEEKEDSSGTEDPVQVEEAAEQVPASKSGPEERPDESTAVQEVDVPPLSAVTSPSTAQVQTACVGQESPLGPDPPPPLCAIDRPDSQPQRQVAVTSSEEEGGGASMSPGLSDEEAPPPTDHMAFMITNSEVQSLSTGEYRQLVSAGSSHVQTVTVSDGGGGEQEQEEEEEEGGAEDERYDQFDRKPVVIIFDEPMDIRSAYKRLSTIFESEEELDRLLPRRTSLREEEEEEEERSPARVKLNGDAAAEGEKGVGEDAGVISPADGAAAVAAVPQGKPASDRPSPCRPQEGAETSNGGGSGRQEGKKRFRFKFPKNKLAAISQALRTGSKTGRKTVQVVVYEEGGAGGGTRKETERFEISGGRDAPPSDSAPAGGSSPGPAPRVSSQSRTGELCRSAYDSISSLEETIKQLEITVDTMVTPPASPDDAPDDAASPGPASSPPPARTRAERREGSPSKRPAPQVARGLTTPPQTKKAKSQPPVAPTPAATSAGKQTAPSGRLSLSRSLQPPDKPAKGPALQASQRQFRQANSSASHAGGGVGSHSPPALPPSKIPAACPSSGKRMSVSAPASTSSAPVMSSSSSSSSSPSSSSNPRSSVPCLILSRLVPASSHASSQSPGNGSPSHGDKCRRLSLPSPQSQNGRRAASPSSSCLASSSSSSSSSSSPYSSTSSSPSSSSSSSSPTSPSLLSPMAGRSVRASAHAPSFPGRQMHAGSGGGANHAPEPSTKDVS